MMDPNERKDTQESLNNKRHRQGSLHPADPDMLTGQSSSKTYSQNRLDPIRQSSLSREQTGASGQGRLSGESGIKKNIVPAVIIFVLGILVFFLIFGIVYKPVFNGNENTEVSGGTEAGEELTASEGEEQEAVDSEATVSAEEETIAPDATVEIPDPVLKKAIQETLGIGNREITGADALALSILEYRYDGEGETIKDFTGLSSFSNLTELCLNGTQVTDISELSGLTKLKELSMVYRLDYPMDSVVPDPESNEISDISALAGLKNLTILVLDNNQISDISALSGLTNLTELYLNNNKISDISTLAGLKNLSDLGLVSNKTFPKCRTIE